MLTLEETTALVAILQSDKSTLSQILEQFQAAFKSDCYSRLALSLRVMLDDNYYNTTIDSASSASTSCQAELLITFYLLYVLSTAPVAEKDEHGADGKPEPTPQIHLPNTRSVLYEQLQKLENFIREKRHKKETTAAQAATGGAAAGATPGGADKDKDKDGAAAGAAAGATPGKEGRVKSEREFDDDEAIRVKTVLKFFILQCITGKMIEALLQKTPNQILRADLQYMETEFDKLGRDPQALREKLKELHLAYEEERKNTFGGFLGKGISPIVISAPGEQVSDLVEGPSSASLSSSGANTPSAAGAAATSSTGSAGGMPMMDSTQAVDPLRFEPVFDRPRPPFLPLQQNELMFAFSEGYCTDLMMDSSLSSEEAMELRELMYRAYRSRLNPENCTQVINILKANEGLLSKIGLTPAPDRLQALIDNNPSIAEYCLIKLVGTRQMSDYLWTLISLQLSLHTMELVNKLAAYNLPKDILHTYIANILHSTRNTTDKNLQTRHVRLVCVFLTSLVRNKTLTDHELFVDSVIGVELLEFCNEFAKIKEASVLFRLLKSVDPNNSSGGIVENAAADAVSGSSTPTNAPGAGTSPASGASALGASLSGSGSGTNTPTLPAA